MNLEYQVRKLDNGLTCLYVPMDTPGSACSKLFTKSEVPTNDLAKKVLLISGNISSTRVA